MTISIQINDQKRDIPIPQSWNDLTPHQAITILHILQLDGPTLMDKRLSALAYLMGLTEQERHEWVLSRADEHGYDWKTVHAAEMQELLKTTDWLLEESPLQGGKGGYQLNATLTKNPFPEIQVKPTPSAFPHRRRNTKSETQNPITLYPPANDLSNITGEELAHLFDHYETYTSEPTPKNADKLIAILYRKSKVETPDQLENNWYGDRRQPLNTHNLDERSQQIGAVMHPMVKNIILFWFLSCRMKIISEWPVVFKSAENIRRDGPDFKWWGVFRAITGDVLKVDVLAKKPYTDLMVELAYVENQRLKEEMRMLEVGR